MTVHARDGYAAVSCASRSGVRPVNLDGSPGWTNRECVPEDGGFRCQVSPLPQVGCLRCCEWRFGERERVKVLFRSRGGFLSAF